MTIMTSPDERKRAERRGRELSDESVMFCTAYFSFGPRASLTIKDGNDLRERHGDEISELVDMGVIRETHDARRGTWTYHGTEMAERITMSDRAESLLN